MLQSGSFPLAEQHILNSHCYPGNSAEIAPEIVSGIAPERGPENFPPPPQSKLERLHLFQSPSIHGINKPIVVSRMGQIIAEGHKLSSFYFFSVNMSGLRKMYLLSLNSNFLMLCYLKLSCFSIKFQSG